MLDVDISTSHYVNELDAKQPQNAKMYVIQNLLKKVFVGLPCAGRILKEYTDNIQGLK